MDSRRTRLEILEADHKISTQFKNLLTCSSHSVQLQAVKKNVNVEAVWRFYDFCNCYFSVTGWFRNVFCVFVTNKWLFCGSSEEKKKSNQLVNGCMSCSPLFFSSQISRFWKPSTWILPNCVLSFHGPHIFSGVNARTLGRPFQKIISVWK